MPNFAAQNIIPSEGLFRTGATNDPGNTLYLFKGGKVYVLAPEGRAGTDDKLNAALQSLGVSRQQYDAIPVYNTNIVTQRGGALADKLQANAVAPSQQDLQSAITTAKPFAQQISTPQADPTAFTGQIPGGLARSVGSAAMPSQFQAPFQPTPVLPIATSVGSRQAPQIAATEQPAVTPEAQFAGAPTRNFTDITSLPENIRNSAAFKALSPEQQEMAAFSWNAMQSTSALTQIRAREALEEATKLAQPAFRQALRLTTDDLSRNIESTLAQSKEARQEIDNYIANKLQDLSTRGERLTAEKFEEDLRDIESLRTIKDQAERISGSREAQVGAEVRRLQNRINDLTEDLTLHRQDITIEEQAELARQLKDYQTQLTRTQESAVDVGLGFSSIRTEAEQRLKEELQDISEGTRRQAARQIRELETTTGRAQRDLGLAREDIERRNQEARTELARQLEQRIGFENIPQPIRSLLGPNFEVLRTQEGQRVRSQLEIEQQERERKMKQEQRDIETERLRSQQEAERQRQELARKEKEVLTKLTRTGEATLGTAQLPQLAKETVTPLGGIQGTLEEQQRARIQEIQQSLLQTQPEFKSLV